MTRTCRAGLIAAMVGLTLGACGDSEQERVVVPQEGGVMSEPAGVEPSEAR